ncbi:hypothetical protein IDJ77_22385 [Mucilaginibacter sp. ZT4R22]|uniref:Uncharacterized protein n=1 Tax=Mucilaginibacter pankratovii TaxID=2772110 RepID=A0ABR7WWC6_9SPHI|nr:hypothetical protein [Mucilaginibacter pankratovii]MBD1366579.1 hypothetical protein [Mucilaginibacter pankratovii]
MIKKIISQIKSVNKYGFVAVLIATSLVAFKPAAKQTTIKWRASYNGSGNITGWTNVNSQVQGTNYNCVSSANICTGQFPSGVTPSASSTPLSSVSGNFNPIP